MRIEVLSVDRLSPQPVQNGNTIGYPCRFASDLGSGAAVLVPLSKDLASYQGRQIRVSLEAASLANLQSRPAEAGATSRLEPLSKPTDYQATGKVVSVIWLSDELENSIVEVLVGEDLVSIPQDTAIDEFTYGEWVSFEIHQLLLVEK